MRSLRRWCTTLFAVACLAAALTSCGSGSDPQRRGDGAGQVYTPVVEIPARWATANARDVRTLVQTTDAVFVGEVTALSGQREERLGTDAGDSNSADPAGKPATRLPAVFPVSIFEVHVQHALAGTLVVGSTVVLEQPGGLMTRADGSRATLILEGDEPLEIGGRYLFFASIKPSGAVTSAPFARFTVANDGSIAPLVAWAGLPAARILAGLSIDEAAIEIDAVAD